MPPTIGLSVVTGETPATLVSIASPAASRDIGTARPSPAAALWLICTLGGLGGCATQDQCPAPPPGPNPTPAQVSTTDGHSGIILRWGGTLTRVRHGTDSTALEVLGYPLDRCGEPRIDAVPIGRFVLVKDGFLETADHPPGSRLTATGLLAGLSPGQTGQTTRLPQLQARVIHWWADVQEPQAWRRPWVSIGIGGGSGGVGGGIGVSF